MTGDRFVFLTCAAIAIAGCSIFDTPPEVGPLRIKGVPSDYIARIHWVDDVGIYENCQHIDYIGCQWPQKGPTYLRQELRRVGSVLLVQGPYGYIRLNVTTALRDCVITHEYAHYTNKLHHDDSPKLAADCGDGTMWSQLPEVVR